MAMIVSLGVLGSRRAIDAVDYRRMSRRGRTLPTVSRETMELGRWIAADDNTAGVGDEIFDGFEMIREDLARERKKLRPVAMRRSG